MKRLTSIFVKGLVAILPLVVTIVLLAWLIRTAERNLSVAIKWILPNDWYTTGMGVLVGLVLIFVMGLLVNIWGVPQVIRLGEKLVDQIPLVKTIYGAVRDLLGFFGDSSSGRDVSKVVMVSLGDTGIRAVGILTREEFDDLPVGFGDKSCVAVYVPFSYQIGGFTLIMPREHVEPLDMSLEDAMRFIVTAGATGTVAAPVAAAPLVPPGRDLTSSGRNPQSAD